MINKEVERCLQRHDRNISWLSKKLGISWTAVKDKLKKNTFTGNELLDLCIIFEDFDLKKLITDRKLELLNEIDLDSNIRVNISGNKIGTLCKILGWQSFSDEKSVEIFNQTIPKLSMTIKKSLLLEKNLLAEMDSLNLTYSIENI